MKLFFLIPGLTPVIALVICGIAIKYKKAYWLISGYNTMSAEKKKNVNTEGLGKLVANVCFLIAGIILIALIFIFLGKAVIALFVFVLLIPIVIYTLIKAQKFDGNTQDSKGRTKKGTKALISVVIGIIIIISISVGVFLYSSSRQAGYAIENGVLKISGIYGQDIPLNQITSLEITNAFPGIITKTNGFDLGSILKGNFVLKDIGDAKLFADTSKAPFIYLKTNSILIILNCEDSEKTKELYQELNDKWNNPTKP